MSLPQDPKEYLQLPPRYQYNDVRFILSQLARGEFCSLLGLGSVGKSTLVKMLPRWDVKQEHFKEWWPFFVIVMLDPHLFVVLNDKAQDRVGKLWMGYELMLNQLRMQLIEIQTDLHQHRQDALNIYFPQNVQTNLLDDVNKCYDELFRGDDIYKQAGIRHVQQAIYELLYRHPNIRVAFVFDEIEEFFDKLPPEFFQSLRGLRDMYKGRIMYVTTSRATLKELAKETYNPDDPENPDALYKYKILESFFELFDGMTHYISPLDPESVQTTLQRLEQRMGFGIQRVEVVNDLVRLSGGHAGLLRRGYRVAGRYNNVYNYNRYNFVRDLLSEKGVINQCESIFYSLTRDEQEAVKLIAHQQSLSMVPHPVIESLVHKHIIRRTQNNIAPTIELFNIWVQETFKP